MKFLATIGALAIIAAIAAAVYFFGGFYNVAGTEPDPKPVAWALGYVRDASIARHATDAPSVSLEGGIVQAGARAFAKRGCVNCHGAPGAEWAKFSEGLRPDPPDLKDVADELTPSQLFFVIKNGINMTGMPGFGLINQGETERWVGDPEIWTIVAFVKKLPNVSEADYKTWTEAPESPAAAKPETAPAAKPETPPAAKPDAPAAPK
jgi:mono/diheme cytochrome c family protein